MTDDVRLSQIDLIDDDAGTVGSGPCSPSITSLSSEAPDDDAACGAGDAFAEIASEIAVPDHDCLTVLCDGISPGDLIVASIVAADTKPTDLILLFNLSSPSSDVSSRMSALEQYVHDRLALLDRPLPMTKVSSAVPALVRQRLYIAGHVFSMPPTTASLDLIQGVLPAHLIKGVIVLDAHKVVPGSREALVLRLIRDGCRPGSAPFLKLLTTNAVALDGAYNRLERILIGAGIGQVHFWPRFRVRLRRVLARTPIDDVAVGLSLTEAQAQIQAAAQYVLQICLDEAMASARRYLPDLAMPGGNPLATQPDLRLRRLLQPTWHRVGSKTRQLIADMALLRKLFALLVADDCVSFYRFLRSVQATPRMQHSQWLLTAQADRLFKLAKRRVYAVVPGPRLVRSLQANPKWALIREILDEIAADGVARSGPIVIVCDDVSSCGALRELLQVGADAFLEKRWFQFLHSLRLDRIADDDDQHGDDEVSKAFAAKRVEQRLLREEYRRLVEARKARPAAADGLVQATLSQFGVVTKSTAAKRGKKKAKVTTAAAAPAPAPASSRAASVSLRDALAAVPTGTTPTLLEDADDVPVMFWARGSDHIPLHLLNPMYVIVYNSDVGVLRQLEMAKSRRPSVLHRVYTVMYDDSVEDATHHERIRRECDVFESLAQQKARMVLPSTEAAAVVPAQADLGSTRQGGGAAVPAPSVIIIDLREFRSSLPGSLYEAGVRIVPCTLEVGDYVLAPDLCVERKSVADLIGSLNSGRLFAQLTAMKRYYPHPFLLIEFDANHPFSFQLDLHGSVSASQICTRLAMICLAFPEIRIMWSRSPQASASMFARLKSGRPQPDVGKAATIANDDDDDDSGSYAASDMLRRLPGVTPNNIHQLMRLVTCLADVARLDRAALSKVLGAGPAANLFEFLHADMASL